MIIQYRWHHEFPHDWHIYCGISAFLVAEGPCWSVEIGRKLFQLLQSGQLTAVSEKN